VRARRTRSRSFSRIPIRVGPRTLRVRANRSDAVGCRDQRAVLNDGVRFSLPIITCTRLLPNRRGRCIRSGSPSDAIFLDGPKSSTRRSRSKIRFDKIIRCTVHDTRRSVFLVLYALRTRITAVWRRFVKKRLFFVHQSPDLRTDFRQALAANSAFK